MQETRTYGGQGTTTLFRDIAVDEQDATGNKQLYFVGYSGYSQTPTDMPLSNPTGFFYQGSVSGTTSDGFILRLNENLGNPSWGTYFGGQNREEFYSVSISDNRMVAVGKSTSTCNGDNSLEDFPLFDDNMIGNYFDGENPNGGASGDWKGFVSLFENIDDMITPANDFTRTEGAIIITPNPSSGMVTIGVEENLGSYELLLLDINGRILHKYQNLNQKNTTLDLSHLSKGVYVIQLKTPDKLISNKLILH